MKHQMADRHWRRSPAVAFVDDGERIALLDLRDPRQAQPKLLYGPAAAVWRALERSELAANVIETVAGQFSVPADQISLDVESFLRALEEEGFIDPSSTKAQSQALIWTD